MSKAIKHLYEFGPFRVDPDQRLLLRDDHPVPLQPKAFDTLLVLLQHPGEVVLKDDLMKSLWPDSFVEESNLSQNIFVLRKALGDKGGDQRYIVTLPGRGYRFDAEVREVTVGGQEPASEVRPSSEPTSEGRAPAQARDVAVSPMSISKRWRWVSALTVILLVIGIIVAVRVRSHAALNEADMVLVPDFVNTTGDAVFDGTLKQALTVEIGQSPYVNVLSDRKIGQTLKLMGRPAGQPVTIDAAREICQRTGTKALVAGTISSLGRHYVIGLEATTCQAGDSLAREKGEANSKEEVLKTLSAACSRLRTKLGESLRSVQRFSVPIEVTTSSLEALKSYSLGVEVRREKGDEPSIPFLKAAIELDPNFPMAYAELAARYANLQQPSLALEYATKAYQLRDRVSQREKLRITTVYFHAAGEREKSTQAYEEWIGYYPHDYFPHASLCVNYAAAGQYEKALGECQTTLRLAPDAVVAYLNLGIIYLNLGRLQDAKATFDAALAKGLDSLTLRYGIYSLAFLQGDTAEMEKQIAWAAGKPGAESVLLSAQSDTEAYYGRLGKARTLSRQAAESASRLDSKEAVAEAEMNTAQREADLGNNVLARQGVAAALGLSTGRDVKLAAALTLARIGDAARARALLAEAEKSNATETVLRSYWRPTINAAAEISKNNASAALKYLEDASSEEMGQKQRLYPAYLRGQAYLLEHNSGAAVGEFQKLLSHRGIVLNSLPGALANMQLARGYAIAGDNAKAKDAYQNFFALWKDADANLPLLMQARADYAKLQ